MKIVAVIGSIRKGNTKRMVEAACTCFDKSSVRLVDLSEINMHFCNGCLYCDETQKCNIDDDMSKIIDEIVDADGFIFASPVRWSLLSGEMKTFFDRLNPLATTDVLSGKKCILLTVGQSIEKSEDAFSIDEGLNSLKAFCINAGIVVVECVKAYGCLNENDVLHTEYLDACKKAGVVLSESIRVMRR